jgi:hypothetical protein
MILRAIAHTRRLAFAPAARSVGRATARMERNFEGFVRSLTAHRYALDALDSIVAAPEQGRLYLRHDVRPKELMLALGLAALHQKLQVPGTFHLTWDMMEGIGRFEAAARRFRQFDSRYVRLGLQCDPVSRWLAQTRFAEHDRECERYVRSANFADYLEEMLQAWRDKGEDAAVLRTLYDGAWQCLGRLDRSFRSAVGNSLSISGRGSPLSNAFERACAARPELAVLAGWFSPIDFLMNGALEQFGYRFEATRFPPGGGPGPVVVFGGAPIEELREEIEVRVGGGGGLVVISPVENWAGDRYADLLPFPGSAARREPAVAASGTIPSEPFFTRERHLARLGWRCERFDRHELAAASRSVVGGAIDLSFPRFVRWLRSEGYVFDGFENGSLRFAERRAYLRYDVHIQDLLAAYVLADLHEQLRIVGSFQLMWKFSRYEEGLEPYFTKLLEFDRRYVQFGLHAAPAASWYLSEKLAGDFSRQGEAMASPGFTDWLLELHAAYCRDGDDAPALREIRASIDDTLTSIAASFRATFGDWKSISAHGNYLTNGFLEVCARHPEVNALRPYFHPVDYFGKWGVERFGFDYEITWLGADAFGADAYLPRVLMEGSPEETRRQWYRGRVAHGAGFVALLHPATWTCSQNATFFLPEEAARDGVTEAKGAGDRLADRPA